MSTHRNKIASKTKACQQIQTAHQISPTWCDKNGDKKGGDKKGGDKKGDQKGDNKKGDEKGDTQGDNKDDKHGDKTGTKFQNKNCLRFASPAEAT